jgi:hypothetical protein
LVGCRHSLPFFRRHPRKPTWTSAVQVNIFAGVCKYRKQASNARIANEQTLDFPAKNFRSLMPTTENVRLIQTPEYSGFLFVTVLDCF